MSDLAHQAAHNLRALRTTKPLIHNITNFVVMNFTANALLASGASPVMAHAQNEVEDMVSIAQAVVLNIGTLSDSWVTSMLMAAQKAAVEHKPVVLDPVGAGATPLRTQAAQSILKQKNVTVLRANASEILALAHQGLTTKGVDAVHGPLEVTQSARTLALDLGIVVAVTGAMDLVTDGQRQIHIHGGHPLMPKITGTGCTASALVGAFLAVEPDPLVAATSALAFLAVAGKQAGHLAQGPGSFQVQLLDTLHNLRDEDLAQEAQIQEINHA